VIILDTNVISEMFRPRPDPQAMAWLQRQADDTVFITSITHGELLFGIRTLPAGRRREILLAGLLRILEPRFASRVLPYDASAADAYAGIAADRRAAGRPISHFDAMIAAIARVRGAQLATRNVGDFEGCGITIVDPWHS